MTYETYDNLKNYIGSKDDFTDDLINMGFSKGYRKGRAEAIEEIDKILLNRFDCDDLRTDWTNADIRETIHFELEQIKENKDE